MTNEWKAGIAIAVLLAALAVPLVAPAQEAAPPKKTELIAVDEIKPGMKGYGLTVFKGTEIEKFEVEVIDVLKNYFPKQDIIMIKCTHPVTDHANIIGGMSGSPIYLEGRLAGALAYGFVGFAKDPIAGVTPIHKMLEVLERPVEQSRLPHEPVRYEDDVLKPCMIPLMVSGITCGTLKRFKPELEKLGLDAFAGGGAGHYMDLDIPLEPGSAVGIQLMRGDWSLDGVGTVTYRDGDKLAVFGHSMLDGGQICMPMTTAYVNQVMASMSRSFKMATTVKAVGTFSQDRMAACTGTFGPACPMVPLDITVKNKATDYTAKYKLEMIQQEQITPLLLNMALSNALDTAEPGGFSSRTIWFELTLHLKDMKTLVLSDMIEGDRIGMAGMPAMLLMGNPFKKVQLERAEINVSVRTKQLVASIESVVLDTIEVKPGATLTLGVTLRPFDSPTVKRELKVTIPGNMPAGEYEIAVANGPESFEPPSADSIEDIVQALSERYKSNELVATH
ncbi:MAG: SpoIVB peptidase S55 domain-containing protein [Planctomycetota bacterium]|nr:SpoIVB peptidase S55 domain-containing protein [Planctomycetota bacterium]